MTMQTYALTPGRINKFKGRLLARAIPMEVLSKAGRQVQMPKNSGDTYIARRYLPFNASTSAPSGNAGVGGPNQFFGTTTATDRGTAYLQAHATSEGVTPTPDNVQAMDFQVVMQQYSCLYGFSDKTYNLYEDDIPAEMTKMVGERMTLVNEMIVYGALKASTNYFYAGGGTTLASVNTFITIGMLRKIARSLMANHGGMVTSTLKAGPNYATEAVAPGFFVYIHTDTEPDIRDLPGFIPAEKYASGSPMSNEIGKCERFRFITSPDLPSRLDSGAAVGTTGCLTNLGTSIDVYQFVVLAEDAFSQVAVRGLSAMDPTFIAPGTKDKSDPLGQRGYVGCAWWKAAQVENNSWVAIGNVGSRNLS